MRWYWLIVCVLAVWRVTHLLVAEDGPWHLMVRLRRWASDSLFGQLLGCFYCASLWVSAPAAWVMGSGWEDRVLLWLALSGAAILLERVTGKASPPPAAMYHEDPEDDDGMLRKK